MKRSHMSGILMLIMLAASALTGEVAAGTTTTPAQGGVANWIKKHESFNAKIKEMDGKIDLVFMGDSITARWGEESFQKHWGSYRTINMGIGGDRTQNVLWRLENGNADGYKARLFVLLIGTNNTDKKTENAEVAAGIKKILELIQSKQPRAKILLLGIFPTGAVPGPKREKLAAINDMISKFAGGSVHYMDIGDKFLEPDKTISKEVMGDGLHLGARGFDIWAEAISGKIKELMGDANHRELVPE